MKITALMLALLCAGCIKKDEADMAAARSNKPYIYRVDVYRDAETGCEYVGQSGGDGIVPRMGADGKQVCTGAQ